VDKKRLDTLKNLPTLLAEKGEEAKLRDLLTDFEFLKLKVETFGFYPLLEDYNLVPNKDEQLELFYKVLVAESHILNEKPSLLFQQLYNKLVWNADEKLRRSLHEAAQKYSRAWLKRLNLPAAFTNTQARSTLVNNQCTNISALQWHCAGVVAAGYEDGTLRLWNLSSGQMQHCFELDKSKVLAVGFNFCGSKLCAFTAESLLAVFDITTRQLLQTRRLKADTSICAAFSLPTPELLPSLAFYTTQKELVVVHNDEDLHIIPHEVCGQILAITFLGHQLVLAGITDQQSHQYTGAGSYSPASLIKVISLDGIEEVVNTESQHGFNTCCHGYIECVSSTPDGKRFATASHMFAMDEYSEYEGVYLGEAAVWQKNQGVWEPSFRASRGVGIFAIAFGSDQQQTVGVEWGEGLTLWDNEGKRIETKKITSDDCCCSLIVTSENKPTVLVGVNSAIHCLALDDIANPRKISAAFHHHGEVKTADISPDLSLIATGSVDFKIAIQEVRPGNMAHLLWEDAHTERVNSVVFSPDGQRVYSGGYDWIIKCWSAQSGERLGEFSDSGFGRIGTLGVAPDGDMLFCSSVGNHRFVVLDRDLDPLIAISMGFDSIFRHVFSLKNHLLALAVGNGIALLDIQELLETSPKYTGCRFMDEDKKIFSATLRIDKIHNVSAMCFSHQSDMLAVGNPSSVSLLQIQGEQILHTWKYNEVRALAFSKDDRFLACGTNSGIAILSLKSGKEISWVPTTSPVISLRFSFDGNKLAAVDDGRYSGHQPEIYLFQFEEPKTE